MKTIKAYKLNPEAKLPTRNHEFDCGLDLYSLYDYFIPVGEKRNIETGIALLVEPGFLGKIEDRSSMANKGLRTGAGIVDPGYSGDISVVLHNLSANTEREPILHLEGYRIRKGDKVGQIVIIPVELPFVVEVNEIWNSNRSNKGFGSSGR